MVGDIFLCRHATQITISPEKSQETNDNKYKPWGFFLGDTFKLNIDILESFPFVSGFGFLPSVVAFW